MNLEKVQAVRGLVSEQEGKILELQADYNCALDDRAQASIEARLKGKEAAGGSPDAAKFQAELSVAKSTLAALRRNLWGELEAAMLRQIEAEESTLRSSEEATAEAQARIAGLENQLEAERQRLADATSAAARAQAERERLIVDVEQRIGSKRFAWVEENGKRISPIAQAETLAESDPLFNVDTFELRELLAKFKGGLDHPDTAAKIIYPHEFVILWDRWTGRLLAHNIFKAGASPDGGGYQFTPQDQLAGFKWDEKKQRDALLRRLAAQEGVEFWEAIEAPQAVV